MATIVSMKTVADDTESFRRQFSSNLNQALDHVENMPRGHGRITAAAQLFGVSVNTMTGWIKGASLPEIWRLPEIARKLDTTIDQLITGDFSAPGLIDEQYAVVGVHGQHEPEDVYSIYAMPETLKFLRLGRDVQLMRVESSDMEGMVNPGDFVIYDPGSRSLGMTSGVFVLSVGGSVLVRRVCRTLRGQIVLSCDNPHVPDETLADEDFAQEEDEQGKIRVLGKVVGILSLQH